jgi:hypothetical protein
VVAAISTIMIWRNAATSDAFIPTPIHLLITCANHLHNQFRAHLPTLRAVARTARYFITAKFS